MKKVSMPKKEFVKEHKHLDKVLKSPSKEVRMKEAKKQHRELKEKIAK